MATIEEVLGRDIAFKSDFVLTPTGDLDTIAGLENLKDALLRRLVTTPGTLIHRPTYGVGIKSYLNGLNSLGAQRQLGISIKEQFELDSRVEKVTSVKITNSDSNPGLVVVEVRIKVVGYQETAIKFVPFGDI